MAARRVVCLLLSLAALALAARLPTAFPKPFELPKGIPESKGALSTLRKVTAPARHARMARNIADPPTNTPPTPTMNTTEFLDRYERGFLHWVGNGSQTVLLLTYSVSQMHYDFYSSEDYGNTWTLNNQLFASTSDLSTLAASVANTNNVMFAESNGRGVWSSGNAAASVTFHATTFIVAAESLWFSPEMDNLIVARDINQQVYFSMDLGATWTGLSTQHGDVIVQSAMTWGNTDFDDCDVLFVQNQDGHVYRFSLSDYPRAGATIQLTTSIVSPIPASFVLDNEYLFVEAGANGVNVDLYVSLNRSTFSKALFPHPALDFIVVDASEHMAIVAVEHASNLSNLYISSRHGLKFSLSLSSVLLVDQNGVRVVDFQRVLGLEGLYIATQLTSGAEYHQMFQTVMTYNKGGYWERIDAPDGSDCNLPSCALNLHLQYSHIDPRMRTPAVYSTPAAPGYLAANGNLGANLFMGGQTFFSADAGLSWDQVRNTTSQFHMLDSGSVIVLGPSNFFELTSTITYSLDDGTTWQTVELDEPLHVVTMLSEPGNRALTVLVAGLNTTYGMWVVSTISFLPVLPNQCTASDYYSWSPRDEVSALPCVLGADMSIQRRMPDGDCHNGFTFQRNQSSVPCECTSDDFDCDYGFARDTLMSPCLPVNNSIAIACTTPGQVVSISHGYRVITDDVCVGGLTAFLSPMSYTCPSYPTAPTAPTTPGTGTTQATTTAHHMHLATTTAAPASSSSNSNSHNAGLVAGLIISMLLLVVAGIVIVVLLRRRGARNEPVRYAPLQSADEPTQDKDDDMLGF